MLLEEAMKAVAVVVAAVERNDRRVFFGVLVMVSPGRLRCSGSAWDPGVAMGSCLLLPTVIDNAETEVRQESISSFIVQRGEGSNESRIFVDWG